MCRKNLFKTEKMPVINMATAVLLSIEYMIGWFVEVINSSFAYNITRDETSRIETTDQNL